MIIIGILADIAIPMFFNQRQNGLEAQTRVDIRNAVTNAESDAAENNGSYANVTLTDIQQGISTDNMTLGPSNVSATNFCITGTNTTNTAIQFYCLKSSDGITAGTACT